MNIDEIIEEVNLLIRIANNEYKITSPGDLAPIWQFIYRRMIGVSCAHGVLTVHLLQAGKAALSSGKGLIHRVTGELL